MEYAFSDVLKRRYSCRNFTGEQITDEELTDILQAGNAAPIAMNHFQDISITVVQNKDILHKLEYCGEKLFEKMGMKRSVIYEAPTLIIVAAKRKEGAFERAQICSAACIMENMSLEATNLNLGSVYLTGIITALNMDQKLLQELGIQDNYETISALAVGKAQQQFPCRDLTKNKIKNSIIR